MHGPTGNAWPKPPELALRLLLATLLVLALAQGIGREAAQAMLPLIGHTLSWLDDHYRTVALTLGTEGADSVVRLRVTLARPLLVGGHLILPDARGWGEVTTPVGKLLQPLLVLLGLLLAWPVRRRREWPLRLLLAAPIALALVLLDTPFALWSHLWDLHAHVYEPGRFSPLLTWTRLLDGGGRLLLGMLGAAAIVALASRLCTPVRRTGAAAAP
ncbi:MAG: hypothetical protein FD157_2573 [Rhodocyclaceae bacterium]|nr:MAG: hypothetical protein FD157_2573 [Rhodocyclaceae bacterium]TND02004.1 MAG: hypothetical protein FD118_2034 [Rhodocyclaceae bacterium]